jgi:3-oxoacyl-[acyl-carrier-protein] synthase-3
MADLIHIIGTGSYVPAKALTNADLEKMVETSDEWITTRTGIKERHIAAPEEATSDMAINAARLALADAGVDALDIDLIIVATTTPDMFLPSTACFVQKALGAKNAAAFDISAACSGFIYTLETARALLTAGTFKRALVIGAEKISAITNWKDRSTCVLFGDGAGAAVLQKTKGKGILSTCLRSDGNLTDILSVPAGGSRRPVDRQVLEQSLNTIHMQGKEVFKLAVTRMVEAAKKALELAGKNESDLNLLIPHQANLRIIEAIAERVQVKRERIFVNLHKYGNMSAATTIVALDEARRSGQVKPGDLIELVAFGAGLTWGAAVIQF